jgi:hypothetical protein
LLSLSTKSNQPIDLEAVLKYPLFPVLLNLANPDGSKRSTQKSKLLEIISSELDNSEAPSVHEISTYVLDMIAQLRMCLVCVSGTFETLAKRFIESIPTGYKEWM